MYFLLCSVPIFLLPSLPEPLLFSIFLLTLLLNPSATSTTWSTSLSVAPGLPSSTSASALTWSRWSFGVARQQPILWSSTFYPGTHPRHFGMQTTPLLPQHPQASQPFLSVHLRSLRDSSAVASSCVPCPVSPQACPPLHLHLGHLFPPAG